MGHSQEKGFQNSLGMLFFSLALLFCLTRSQALKPKVVICYYDATSYWREGLGRFLPQQIEGTICTHIIYSFIGIKNTTSRIYSLDPGLDLGPGEEELDPDIEHNNKGDLDMIRKTVNRRDEANPDLKILMSVGGPSQQSQQSFSIMAGDIDRRNIFIESVIEYIERFSLDGLDLYWLYPGEVDKQNFVQLVKELREAFTSLSSVTGKQFILTAALGCTKDVIDTGYNLEQLAIYVDYFNLLCFSFKTFSNESEASQKIGHHSPLHKKDSESPADQQLTVSFGLDYFLQLHAPSEKLVLGVATHANTYTLESRELNYFYDEALGPGSPGEYTFQDGFLAYFEICAMIKQSPAGWVFSFDYDYSIPFLYNDSQWIGYDNEISVQEKVDFSVEKNLGGLMVKFIDLDDAKNICGGWNAFPITAAIKDRLEFWEKNSKEIY